MSVAKTKKIQIEITEAQEKFLKTFAEKQYPGAKDNLATVSPIHVVQTRRERVINPDYDSCDHIAYYNTDMEMGFDSLKEMVESYYEDDDIDFEIIPYEKCQYQDIKGYDEKEYHIYDENDYCEAYGIDGSNVHKTYVGYYYETVAFFFIREEAERYMKYQGHNLTSPRVYTYGPGYSNCGDYVPFWNLLMNIGQKLNEVKGNDVKEKTTNCKDNVK